MADSTRSHCLLHYAASVSLEKQQALVELLLKIHFLDAKNLNDVTVLLDAAKEVKAVIVLSEVVLFLLFPFFL